MTDRELMQQALHALELIDEAMPFPVAKLTIKNLRERLAQPEQEPVAWRYSVQPQVLGASYWAFSETKDVPDAQPLYTTLPQRKPLPPQSPCEMTQAEGKMFKLGWLECEAAHGIKGEA